MAKRRGWDVKAIQHVSMQEQNRIWDEVRRIVVWRESEAVRHEERLARRFDLGMALNEGANRAMAEKKTLGEHATAAGLTDKQRLALEVQAQYLNRVVRRS